MNRKTAWHGEEEGRGIGEYGDRMLHGDVLDAVVARVSALDLLPASCVSKQWRTAVLAAARRSPRRAAPWLVLSVHGGRKPVGHAFNPISRSWRSVALPAGSPFAGCDGSAVHVSSFPCCSAGGGGSGGAGIYALSSTRMALAADLFGTTWRELEPLRSWRTDPVVALVGRRLVVAGGACELLEDDPASVEVWDGRSGGWATSDPMPDAFRWSPTISAAASERRLYAVEKQPPFAASWFDPEAKRWGPTHRLQIPDPTVRHVSVAFASGRLLLATAGGGGGRFDWQPQTVRLWEVDQETLEVKAEQLAEMPQEMVAALADEGGRGMQSLGFLAAVRFAYLYNPLFMKFFFLCELDEGGGGGSRWEAVPRPPSADERPMHRVVFSCSEITVDDSVPTKL